MIWPLSQTLQVQIATKSITTQILRRSFWRLFMHLCCNTYVGDTQYIQQFTCCANHVFILSSNTQTIHFQWIVRFFFFKIKLEITVVLCEKLNNCIENYKWLHDYRLWKPLFPFKFNKFLFNKIELRVFIQKNKIR